MKSKQFAARLLVSSLLVSTIFSYIGCAETAEFLPEGRCRINEDCPDGHTCRASYCEDIYFPRKDIKPY